MKDTEIMETAFDFVDIPQSESKDIGESCLFLNSQPPIQGQPPIDLQTGQSE